MKRGKTYNLNIYNNILKTTFSMRKVVSLIFEVNFNRRGKLIDIFIKTLLICALMGFQNCFSIYNNQTHTL